VLLVPEKNAVLINTRKPQRLLDLIPTAKQVQYKGHNVVAVPHRLDETRVLNNLGCEVPSPITARYPWPRSAEIEKPFDAQVKTAAMLTLNSRAFVLNDLGTGKSLAALWAYDFLRKHRKAEKMLIICPMSTMDRTWADELFFHLGHRSWRVLYGSRKKRLQLLEDDVDIYIINHHGAQIVEEALRERPDITHVILDEISQVARNRRTDMWSAFDAIINGAGKPKDRIKRAAWGLTATPIPNSPVDAWAQVRLINPGNVTPYFTAFRNRVMDQKGPYTWVPKKNALDVVDKIMQPAVRFRRSDCIDLPPTIYMTREAKLTAGQEKAFKSMESELKAQFESGEILAVNEAVKAGKLVQIACGVAYDKHGNEITIGAESRIKVVVEAIEASDSKSIVFVPYVSSVKMVAELLREMGYPVETIYGGVKKAERDRIFASFQNSELPRVIVAQPAAMSHGLTLTRASTIVWYAPPTSADIYEQANGRITRPGQKYTTVIVNVEGTSLERRMYARLKKKQSMQNLLLERKSATQAA